MGKKAIIKLVTLSIEISSILGYLIIILKYFLSLVFKKQLYIQNSSSQPKMLFHTCKDNNNQKETAKLDTTYVPSVCGC